MRTGSFSQGQGHETTFAQIASERLGIPIEKITVSKGDTDVVPRGTGTYGSKSTQIGGVAAGKASEEVVETASASRPPSSRRRRRTWSSTSTKAGSM